jgi:hypothetical protein
MKSGRKHVEIKPEKSELVCWQDTRKILHSPAVFFSGIVCADSFVTYSSEYLQYDLFKEAKQGVNPRVIQHNYATVDPVVVDEEKALFATVSMNGVNVWNLESNKPIQTWPLFSKKDLIDLYDYHIMDVCVLGQQYLVGRLAGYYEAGYSYVWALNLKNGKRGLTSVFCKSMHAVLSTQNCVTLSFQDFIRVWEIQESEKKQDCGYELSYVHKAVHQQDKLDGIDSISPCGQYWLLSITDADKQLFRVEGEFKSFTPLFTINRDRFCAWFAGHFVCGDVFSTFAVDLSQDNFSCFKIESSDCTRVDSVYQGSFRTYGKLLFQGEGGFRYFPIEHQYTLTQYEVHLAVTPLYASLNRLVASYLMSDHLKHTIWQRSFKPEVPSYLSPKMQIDARQYMTGLFLNRRYGDPDLFAKAKEVMDGLCRLNKPDVSRMKTWVGQVKKYEKLNQFFKQLMKSVESLKPQPIQKTQHQVRR